MSVPENDPSQNITIHPGDRIEVIYKPRTFTVFGATGKVSEVPFTVPELSLSEAIARTGGPLDQQSDPNGIFLLRYEDNDVVRRLGLPVAKASRSRRSYIRST
jgi:polysaccharide export outer membrane protein